MEQLKLIEKVKENALKDSNVSAVLMYGSFTKGEGDQFSDVEFYIFLHSKENFNSQDWVNNVRPTIMFFTNEFGTEVAVFDNMIRGEFHFHEVSEIDMIYSWQGQMSFENRDKMNLVDKDGKLTHILNSIELIIPPYNTPENIQWIAESLINNLIMTGNILKRKETAHAHQCFIFIQRHIISLIRIHNNSTQHWEAPAKKLEEEIPTEWYKNYIETTAASNQVDLEKAFQAALRLVNVLFNLLKVDKNLLGILKRIN